jgi:large subunit ribosomal protein L28
VCEVCDKRPAFGNNVSHANNRSRRRWSPNIHRTSAPGASARGAW